MDAESLAQIEQIVSTAVKGAEARLGTEIATAVSGTEDRLRAEMQALGTSLRQEFEVKLSERFEEAERHSGVLFKEMGRRLDLVIEGHQALHQKIEAVEARLEAKIDHEALEIRSLLQLSYRQLQDRVETLEQRVMLIEKRLGLAN